MSQSIAPIGGTFIPLFQSFMTAGTKRPQPELASDCRAALDLAAISVG
jgi:hypothetical protein